MSTETIHTLQEVADLLRVDRSTAQRLVQSGNFPGAFTIGSGKRKFWRVPDSGIQQFRQANEVQPDPMQPRPKQPSLVEDLLPYLRREPKTKTKPKKR